ncbi:hypothetical protein CJU90_0054 [Yarrowia sp. C11]|nr:hypothetical protein CKK34_1465 [Yarrowia sp. E02]KAG5372419.1 hypothetical protein CJU90_0054 [Yarrowia sp. C11]
MSAPASDNEISLGSVPDIDTFIQAEKTREDATEEHDKEEVVATKETDNEVEEEQNDHIEVDEFGTNPEEQVDEQLDEKHEQIDQIDQNDHHIDQNDQINQNDLIDQDDQNDQIAEDDQNDVPELEDSIMEEYDVNEDEEDLQHEQVEAEKTMEVEQKTTEVHVPEPSVATPQIDTSFDFSDHQEVLNLPKKRVPSYLQPTISYSQKVRAKYDPRSVSASSQRSFSGSRTYSAEYHLREARLFEQRHNEMDVGGRLSRDGAGSPDSTSTLEVPKLGGSRKIRREYSREFTPSFPFNKENVN